MTALWEKQIDHPLMHGQLNIVQITLICALHLERRNPGIQWRPDHPNLSEWTDRISERTSFAQTLPALKQL
jgi:glutathione S-transferase